MSQEDGETDVPTVQSSVDTVQVDTAWDVSQMQDDTVGYATQEVKPEDVKYRVMVTDFGCSKNDMLYVDYFDNYDEAYEVYANLCDGEDGEFIKYHDRKMVLVILSKAYRGFAQIFWEDISQSPLYKEMSN